MPCNFNLLWICSVLSQKCLISKLSCCSNLKNLKKPPKNNNYKNTQLLLI